LALLQWIWPYCVKRSIFRADAKREQAERNSSFGNTQDKNYSKGAAMTSRDSFEQTATLIAVLGKDELKKRIRNFRGRFRLDFTEDYLNNLSVERLRHILLAALINAKPHV
jgi:hypothetical protein